MRNQNNHEVAKKKLQPHNDIIFNKKIVAPQKLKILVLSGNDIVTDQLQFLHRCVSLLKLDLSHNNIIKIPQKIGLQKLPKLEILYLHNNKIENAAGLQGVFMIPKLVQLTIRENPIERLPRIEHLIVNVISTLKVINDRVIFVQQRSQAFFYDRTSVFIESEISQGWKVKDNSEAQYMKILQMQLRYYDNVWMFNNPIIRIQRMWKSIVKSKRKKRVENRRRLQKKDDYIQISEGYTGSSQLQYFFYQWKSYAKNLKAIKKQLIHTNSYPENKIYMTDPLQRYKKSARNIRVEKVVRNFVAYIRYKIYLRKMAEKIYRRLKIKTLQFNNQESFYHSCGIDKTNRFYFNKIQTHLLQNLLAHIGQNFPHLKKHVSQTHIGPANQYLSIRTVDPQTFSVKSIYSVFTYTIWPSMRVIFLKKKKYQSKQRTGLITIKPLLYIKNANKILTKQEFKKSCKVYKRLQKFYKKEYQNSLDYFQCTNPQLMKMLIRYVYYHNSKTKKFEKLLQKNDMQSLLENYEEPLMIYADLILERNAAAVRIQQNWRKYLVQKNSKESIYFKMKKTRAALRIQRFWRDLVFYHRLSFQRNIDYQLKVYNMQSIMIPSDLYHKFPDICGCPNQLYQGLSLTKSNVLQRQLTPAWKMPKAVFSPYIVKKHFPSLFQQNQIETETKFCDAWNILHCGSTVMKIKYCNKEFYQFKFKSVEQARYRIFLLALFSYKCRGGTYFLPITRDTLQFMSIRFEEYQSMGLYDEEKKQRGLGKKQKEKDMKLKKILQKVSIIRVIEEKGIFLTQKNTESIKKGIRCMEVNLEFYQKVFKDFPKKYTGSISYGYLSDESGMIQVKSEQKKHQKNQYAGDQNNNWQSSNQRFEKMKDTLNDQYFSNNMNEDILITKVDKKKLSFYDIGYKNTESKNQERSKNEEKQNTTQQLFFNQAVDKKQGISKLRLQETSKKKQYAERKAANLKKIRQDVYKQRLMNTTFKNMKELQRTQQLKKKVEKVKQMKSRANSTKKQDHQEDFVQQGNFVMQQQLKMIIMRSKMQNMKPKNIQKSQSSSWKSQNRNTDGFSRSFYTEQRNKQIKVYENNSNVVPHSLGTTFALNNNNNQQLISGEQKKIINVRSQKRNKSRSIGAYIRDPSLVHGVFPQQYYPIQAKDGGQFKFLPPLL